MGCFINEAIGYYEGDRITSEDIEVTQRPSIAHDYSEGEWSINKDKFNDKINSQISAMEYKEILSRTLRESELQTKPLLVKLFLPWAASLTIEQIVAELLDENGPNYAPGYKRLYLFDAQIGELRRSRI